MSNLPSTSHEANVSMTKELREIHHAKILTSLEALGEAIYEVIAWHCGMEKHQIGRRLKELCDAGKIYNTLRTGLTSTNRKANMYAIRKPNTVLPKQETHYREGECTAADYASEIIAKTKQGKLTQTQLFNELEK